MDPQDPARKPPLPYDPNDYEDRQRTPPEPDPEAPLWFAAEGGR